MRRDDPRHGTPAGAQAHRKEGVRPCKKCRDAANGYHRTWVEKNRDRMREEGNARSRALWKLANLHPDEFQVLLSEELPAQEKAS